MKKEIVYSELRFRNTFFFFLADQQILSSVEFDNENITVFQSINLCQWMKPEVIYFFFLFFTIIRRSELYTKIIYVFWELSV